MNERTILRVLAMGLAMFVTWPSFAAEHGHATPAGDPHGVAVPVPQAHRQSVGRTDLVTFKGAPLTLLGHEVKAGHHAPAFTAVGGDLSTFTFKPDSGKVTIIAAVPSVDTPVCSAEAKRFNDEASKLGEGVAILTISMDLPFAQKRWCAAEGVKNLQMISDYRDRSFGESYGVRIKENGLLARSVFVVDGKGILTHVQIVSELTKEPDYDAVLSAAKKALEK